MKITVKQENAIRKRLKNEYSGYYLQEGPFNQDFVDFQKALESGADYEKTRIALYRKIIPELPGCFETLMKKWDERLAEKDPCLWGTRYEAMQLISRIVFLTEL
jgi:hypothetical protein